MMCRALLAPLALLLSAGCSATTEDESITHVDITAPTDTSCLGVSGFLVEVTVNGAKVDVANATQMLSLPVLTKSDCRLPSAVRLPNIDLEHPVSMKLTGLDGARNQRVSGQLKIERLRGAGDKTLELKTASAPPLDLLVLDRKALLEVGEADLHSLERLTVTRQGSNDVVVVQAASAGDYFFVGEPWATAVSVPVAEEDVTVRAEFSKGSSLPPVNKKARIVRQGDYFTVVPGG